MDFCSSMAQEKEPLPLGSAAFDAASVASLFGLALHEGPEPLPVWKKGEPAGDAVLLLAGTAMLSTKTPFGDYELCTIGAPAVLGLAELLMLGSPRIHNLTLGPKSASVAVLPGELKALLLEESPRGAACRRLALSSLTRALEYTNLGLRRFFDESGAPPKAVDAGEAADPEMKQKAASAQKVANVFDLLGIDPKALPELGLVERTYPAGAVLAPAGQPGDEAYLIAAGQVRVSVDISGEEALGICHDGEFVGEMALLDRAPRSASLIAHEGPATVFVFSKYVFDALLEKSPKGAARLLAGMATALSIRLEAAFARSTSFYIMSGGNLAGASQMPPPGFFFADDEVDEDS